MIARFSDVLRPEAVLIGLQASDRGGVLDRLGAAIRLDHRVRSPELFMKAVRDREAEGGTVLEGGLWLPHARSAEVTGVVMGVALLAEPLAPDGVQAAFLVGTPPALTADYLRLIGCLARIWKDDKSRLRVIGSRSSAELQSCLDELSGDKMT